MSTATITKLQEVKASIASASKNLNSEDIINSYLDSICKHRDILIECTVKLSDLNNNLYNEPDQNLIYLSISPQLVELKISLIRLIAKIKRNTSLYRGVKTATKDLCIEVDLLSEYLSDMDLKFVLLPTNKKLDNLLRSIR